MQGAGLGVPVVSCTQRPAWVDRLALSEARHLFVFTLADPDDRERAAALMGLRGADVPNTPEPHGFYYRSPDGRVIRCRPLTALRLNG
jgi:DNA helicase HerA-like ATPase